MGKIDPRVVKTRKKLRQAFLDLLKTRQLMDMNIKDLTNQAGVTRGTFYLHYRDKDTFVETIMLLNTYLLKVTKTKWYQKLY